VKSKKYRDMIEKHADIIAARPFFMKDAASYLKNWVVEKDPGTPLLDVSYCSLEVKQRKVITNSPTKPIVDTGALALEPEPGKVVVGRPAQPHKDAVPAGSQLVYNIAENLVKEHGKSWGDAIKMAELIVDSSLKAKGKKDKLHILDAAVAVAADCSDDDDITPIIDVIR
jgi:hypothetical protein